VIGLGAGLGVVAGRAVALAALDALGVAGRTAGDDDDVNTRPGTASHAAITISSSTARALIVLG